MLKAELQHLKKNPFVIIVLLVIALIPAIYCGLFLTSMWNPYGKTDQLSVAVVNQDHSATLQGQKLSLGKDMSKSLKDSKSLDFHVVSAKNARRGLASGKYYATYTIPKNFSHNATTIFSKHPKQLRLHAETSSGHSFFAGKVTASAANTIQAQINGKLDSAYTKSLTSALNKVATGMHTAGTGATKLANGEQKLNSGAKTLDSSTQALANGATTLGKGAGKLANGTQQYVAGVNSAANGSAQLSSGLNKAATGLPALTAGLGTMQSGTGTLANGLAQSADASAKLSQGAASLSANLNTFTNSSQTLASKSQAFNTALHQFATQVKQAEQVGGSKQLASLAKLLQATQKALTASTNAQQQTASAASVNVAKTAAGMNLSAEQIKQLQNAVTSTYTASASKQQSELAPLLTQLQGALNQLQSGSTSNSALAMSGALDQLTSGSAQLANANTQLASAAGKLNAGSQAIASGNAQLASGSQQLGAGATRLNAGLTAALPQVNALQSGVTTMAGGANTLNTGLNTLGAKGQTLGSSASQLATGAGKIGSGGVKLAAGTAQLQGGLGTVISNTQKLATSLNSGAKKIPALHFAKANAKMVASPVAVKKTERDHVPNNGTGLAPYMACVAIYVVAMAVNLMYDTTTPRRKPKSGVDWFASKIVVIDAVAVVAATFEFLTLRLMGLTPVQNIATWFTLVLTALVFMNLVTFLNLALKQIGTFFAFVLLLLQLSTAAGTYPIETTNGFDQFFHPLLPMSYAVEGLRHTISMAGGQGLDLLVLLGFFVGFTLLVMMHYVRNAGRTSAMDFAAPESSAKPAHK